MFFLCTFFTNFVCVLTLLFGRVHPGFVRAFLQFLLQSALVAADIVSVWGVGGCAHRCPHVWQLLARTTQCLGVMVVQSN